MVTETDTSKSHKDGTAIWCITPNGKHLGQKIRNRMELARLFISKKIEEDHSEDKDTVVFDKLSNTLAFEFNQYKNHIFIFSTGIAVRLISSLLNSKTEDPAIVVIDDNGNFVISLISGHIGGANLLAEKTAGIIHATPVITTATDTNHLPAIDMIAQKTGLHIETPQNIKHVNMAFLMDQPVNICDPLNIIKPRLAKKHWNSLDDKAAENWDLFCSHKTVPVSRETLVLRPRILSVGIGCNRNTSLETIRQFMLFVLEKEGLSAHSIRNLATTDVKSDEKGLLALSEERDLPIKFYTKQELNSVTTIQTPSKMVEKHLGVKSVCEAAAILSANHGELIVTKQKNKDVTIAVAIIK